MTFVNVPEIVDIALPAEGVFHNLVFVSIKKTYPMQACKIMHGLWGVGQMMFTKYIVVVDDADIHNTSEVLFRLCANNDPQRDSILTKGPADVLDHATNEMVIGTLHIRLVDKIGGHPEQAPPGRRRGGAQSKDPVECKTDMLSRLVCCHGMIRLRSVPAFARDGTPLSMTSIWNAELCKCLCPPN